jgi:predicted NodU family carbamoyl transferase
VVINTSFNSRGEPIVDSGEDELRAFTQLGLDFLILDGHLCIPAPG